MAKYSCVSNSILISLLYCEGTLSYLPSHITTSKLSSTFLKQSSNDNNNNNNKKEEILSSNKSTVWTEFGKLSDTCDIKANLGQGFPNWSPPLFCRQSLVEAVTEDTSYQHQYTRTQGHPKLVNELSTRYSIHLHRHIDPMNDVAITVGASQALYLALQSLVNNHDDEVIVFEPFFDLYINQIKLAGGTPVPVPLTFVPYDDNNNDNNNGGGEWVLEKDVLESKISSKTRAIILNSPHNPTGKVFTKDEMQLIADAMTSNAHPDCVVLSDEVYKYIIHAPPQTPSSSVNGNNNSNIECVDEECIDFIQKCEGHVHFASLPNMYNKTLTISSAGKTFSATGWQVGWCIGPTHLIKPIHTLLPYVQFCPSTLMQEALARSLHLADMPYMGHNSYYDYLKYTYIQKRDMLVHALVNAGFGVPDYNRTSGGGFFILARITDDIMQALPAQLLKQVHDNRNNYIDDQTKRLDWVFCKWLAQEKGVLCIPSSPFFSNNIDSSNNNERLSDRFIRVAFCKLDETIETASDVFDTLVTQVPSENNLHDDNIVGATSATTTMECNATDVVVVE